MCSGEIHNGFRHEHNPIENTQKHVRVRNCFTAFTLFQPNHAQSILEWTYTKLVILEWTYTKLVILEWTYTKLVILEWTYTKLVILEWTYTKLVIPEQTYVKLVILE